MTPPHRMGLWRALHLAAGMLLLTSSGAQSLRLDNTGINLSGPVFSDEVFYSIGGGRAVSMSPAGNMESLGVGVGWNSNLVCGDMSLSTTVQNQLNGVTNGFHSLMNNVIQNATSAVASLPALIIQRADPALYNLLTNGILQARLDFDRSKASCRALAGRMADLAGGSAGWDQLAEGMALKQTLASRDGVSAVEQAETRRGQQGVPWVAGAPAGGRDQPPIRLISDVTRAGYNLLNGRNAQETTDLDPAQCHDRLICQVWPSPHAATAWANRVLGERELRTCTQCTKTQTTPGVGLTPLIQEEYDKVLHALRDLVAGAMPTTSEQLAAAGSRALPVTRGVIEALRDEPDRDVLSERLASEVALSRVVEQALLLQRLLLTGLKEPNVAANEIATRALRTEQETLTQEVGNLKTELELRRTLTTNAASRVVDRQRERAARSGGIFQGDATPRRLDVIQAPQEDAP